MLLFYTKDFWESGATKEMQILLCQYGYKRDAFYV
jgi:hypothetical protein